MPEKLTIDKSGANTAAITSIKVDSGLTIEVRQSKYLNNIVEQDYRAIKRIVRPMLGESHRGFIEAQLRLRRNAMAIYQDLVDRHGFAGAYNSVKRFVAKLRIIEPVQFDRLSFLPGEEMQLDYGEGAPTRMPGKNSYRKPRLFVATLRYSRRSFRRVVWNSGQETWAQLHEQAWRYFGGPCHYVVLDNLKECVHKPDLYEPQLNPVYAATLRQHSHQ